MAKENHSFAHSKILACPETKQALIVSPLEQATALISPTQSLVSAVDQSVFESYSEVLVRQDNTCAYPIIGGIPILLIPERLTSNEKRTEVDLKDPKYDEAYEEMGFYNKVAQEEAQNIKASESYDAIIPIIQAPVEKRSSFPEPGSIWLDAIYDCSAQWDAYQHIGSVTGQRVAQLGGKGIHAVKFLLAGAAEAWIVTPMLGEIYCALALAREVGVADRLHAVVAVSEELPFQDNVFDAIYSGGCVHHMVTELAFPEIARILRPGGRFGAMDPWKAPLHTVGTKLLGKREPDVHCKPLNPGRVAPFYEAFSTTRLIQHGTLTRYPLLALQKFGIASSLSTAWTCMQWDDRICSFIPGFRKMGSSVALIGTK